MVYILSTSPGMMTGKELRALRESLGITQQELADILQVTRVTISIAERGKPSRALVLYVAHAQANGLLKVSDRKLSKDSRKRRPKKL